MLQPCADGHACGGRLPRLLCCLAPRAHFGYSDSRHGQPPTKKTSLKCFLPRVQSVEKLRNSGVTNTGHKGGRSCSSAHLSSRHVWV